MVVTVWFSSFFLCFSIPRFSKLLPDRSIPFLALTLLFPVVRHSNTPSHTEFVQETIIFSSASALGEHNQAR